MPVEVRDGWEQTERLIDQLVRLNRQIKFVQAEPSVSFNVFVQVFNEAGGRVDDSISVGEVELSHRSDNNGDRVTLRFREAGSLDEHALSLRNTFTDNALHCIHDVIVRAENAFALALDDDNSSSHDSSSSVGTAVDTSNPTEGEARKGFASGGPAGAAPLELQVEELLSEMVAKWTSGRSIDSEIVRLRALNDQMHAMKQRETECCSGVSDK